ncbi:scavenger receptor class B member 1-like isoform X2 [Amphiura filiformis]|uniref:scavenger receptor class B member 1-like isoform X2 n=1 Tax=Amphiura filiformis TaxID=82378 RepID=UPI003B20B79C
MGTKADIPEVDYEKKSSRCCTSTRSCILLVIFGTVGIISGAVVMDIVYDKILEVIVYDMMHLTPSSMIYPEWAEPSIPLTSKFYFWEVTNPDEVFNGGKPALIEKGPYAYDLFLRRDNISNNDNGTISSIPVYTYVFNREKSIGPDTDRFLGVNMPMTSTAYMMRDAPRFIRESMSVVLEELNETMFIDLSVADLLWGYDEPLFKMIHDLFPIEGVDEQFGFLLGYNGTDMNGLFTVYDGKDDVSMLNRIDNWKGKTTVDFWFTDEANMMNGTDGMMWHPFIKKDENVLDLFHPDFCRTMPYVYEEDETFKGIPMRRYALAPYAYANGTTYPPNEGFCKDDTCAPNGIQRMDPCRFGSPMGMSNPHFLYADPSLSEQIIGLNPDEEKHKNYFLLEPYMGMPYVMRQRLQINMFLRDVQGIKQMGDVRTMYIPAIWFAQEVDVPDNVIKSYELGFQVTALIVEIMKYIMIVGGALMVLAGTTITIVKYYRRTQANQPPYQPINC